MDKIQKCFNDVERKLGKIDKMTQKGVNNLSVKEMVKASRKGQSINNTIKQGVKDAQGVTLSETEVKGLLVQMEHIVSLQEKQMALAISNKPMFDKLHVGGMVKKNMVKSEGNQSALTGILVEKASADLKPQAIALDERSKKSFQDCFAVFSNAEGGEDQNIDVADDSD